MSSAPPATAGGCIRVAIGGGQSISREGLKRIVDACPGLAAVAELGDPEQVGGLSQDVDVLLVDGSGPGSRPLEFVLRAQEERPTVKVLVLGTERACEGAVRLLQAGAAGHVGGNGRPEELVEAIRRIHETGRYVSPELGEWLAEGFVSKRWGPSRQVLSGQEYRVLCLLTAGHSAKQIALTMELSPKTISTYRSRLLEKLGLETNAQLIRYGLQRGLDVM